jgi:hypothetical protein
MIPNEDSLKDRYDRIAERPIPDFDDYEEDGPDELECCHHGVGFDEDCEDCEAERAENLDWL